VALLLPRRRRRRRRRRRPTQASGRSLRLKEEEEANGGGGARGRLLRLKFPLPRLRKPMAVPLLRPRRSTLRARRWQVLLVLLVL
jgi:hypothetical protein